ncbi:hypothetical protein LOTGIDRAFT_153663 [Lottia gigantea]|uniref:Uncharacterized protein n=1 Tax=Lottia gigantea TaxID=225164 RepID=V4A3C8_LOTGI|nr:hypothetical protein LOTGIDRAFT_153663 [Lottia gigantea]ESO91232.1 hypothetical protein LOTGIDRAFT_153663 [Lottia gigantea]
MQSVETDSVLQKRLKGEVCLSPGEVSAWQDAGMRTVSAFQPWAPNVISAIKEGKLLPAPAIMREGLTGILPSYLHTGPPVLLHPERVIPYSESERYERHFTPNVSLAPPVSKTDKSEEDGPEECTKNSPSTKSVESSSRASTSGTTNNKDYREYDLPTDTDDSSLEQSSPSDAGDEVTFPDIPEVDSTLEAEIEMIRRVLDGKIPNTKEAKDNFLHEYSKLRVPHEEILNTVNHAKKSLTRELNAQKNRFKEELEKKKFLQKENNRIRIESECRLQEAAEEKEKLVAEVRRLKEREESGMNEKYLQMNMELEGRMQHFKSLYNDLQDENRILREELKRLGVDIVELLQRDKAIMNGKMKHTADIKSDMSSKLLQEALMKGELFFRRNNVLKRERIHLVD